MSASSGGGARAPAAVHRLLRAEAALSRTLLTLGAAALVALAAVSIYQVVTRFVFDRPSTWSEVVARSLMVWSVFLCAPYVVGRGELMAFDLLRRLARGWLALLLHVGVAVAMAAVFLVLTVHGITLMQRASSQSLAGLEFIGARVSWAYAAIPLGSCASVVASLAYLLRALWGVWPDPAPGREEAF